MVSGEGGVLNVVPEVGVPVGMGCLDGLEAVDSGVVVIRVVFGVVFGV